MYKYLLVCTSVHHGVSGAQGAQKKALDPWKLDFQMFVSFRVGAGNQTLGPLEEQLSWRS